MNERDCFVNEEELYLYLDRELDAGRAAILDDHLVTCRDCAARYGVVSKLKSILRESRDAVQAPPGLRDRILSGIAAEARVGDCQS